MRYAAIVLCALLALSWTPSHANALPRSKPERVKVAAPKA